MAATFSSKDDVQLYIDHFTNNNFYEASRYWSPNIKVRLGDRFQIETREANIKFFKDQRRLVNEKITPQAIVLDDCSCAIRAEVIFTALQDFTEGYAGMPPVKLGQRYQVQYLIMYNLDANKQIDTIVGERIGKEKILDV